MTERRRALRPAEAAAVLGIGRTKLWELTRSGALPSVQIGRSRRYLATDLEEFLAGHRSPDAATSALAGTTSPVTSKL